MTRREAEVNAPSPSGPLWARKGIGCRKWCRGEPDAGMSLHGIRSNKGLVAIEVLLRHSPCGKSFLEMRSHLASIEFGKPSDRFNGFRFSWHDKARDAVVDDFG